MTRTKAKAEALKMVVAWLDERLKGPTHFSAEIHLNAREKDLVCFEIRELRHDLEERQINTENTEKNREKKRSLRVAA